MRTGRARAGQDVGHRRIGYLADAVPKHYGRRYRGNVTDAEVIRVDDAYCQTATRREKCEKEDSQGGQPVGAHCGLEEGAAPG